MNKKAFTKLNKCHRTPLLPSYRLFCLAVCELLDEGVTAIFGPTSRVSAGHVQSICDHVAIPHITTQWNAHHYDDHFAINVHPHHETLAHAYLDYVIKSQWQRFTILYDSADGKHQGRGLSRYNRQTVWR